MSDEKKLIPVFVPPLANVLAISEQRKGTALTETEIKSIRDKSVCIMMTTADADQLTKKRGFIDVNPENCWADWHRLRVQFTGNGYLPKLILCIPGDHAWRLKCQTILAEANIEHQFKSRDEQLVQSFKSSSMSWPVFTDEDYAQIQKHESVLYILSTNFVAGDAPNVCRQFLTLGRELLDAGGFAIKCESSGLSHSRARWTKLEEISKKNESFWSALFHAYVVLPIASSKDFYSCGMHLLGAPDLIISQDLLQKRLSPGESTAGACAELFRAFALYLLEECPTGQFGSGHTFSLAENSPRFRLHWEPCSGYAEDDFFFNSFGRWRFSFA